MKKIILCGGGTAGHVMPSLALIPSLRSVFDEIHYVGSVGGMEKDLVESKVDYYHEIHCVKLKRSLSPKNLLIPFRLAKSVIEARKIINEVEPNVIFSKGGFVSLPVCLASKKYPVILHESDFSLGLANKLSLPKCSRLLTSFPINHEKAEQVGSPLRQEIYHGDKEKARKICSLYAPLPYLLVTGGSSGATAINDAVMKNIPALTKKFNVIHVTGKNKANELSLPNYYRTEFLSNMHDFLALADFAVSRGGANTLFELVSLRIPSLIIPLPKSGSSRGDQQDNARYFQEKGLIKVLDQQNLSSLLTAIDDLVSSKDSLISNMKNAQSMDGTQKITKILTQYA